MLHEYALEPSLLANWHAFRFFVNQFGFDRGRLIARFPSKWKRMVYEGLGGCRDVERARIEEALRRIDDRMVKRPDSNWDQGQDWLTNAEFEHSRDPFRAIIAVSNQRQHPEVVVGDDLDDTIDPATLAANDSRRLWRANRSQVIKRNASEMADVVDAFLKYADQILFIDKHFGPENSRHRIPFEEFLSRLDGRQNGKMPQVIEVHCAKKATEEFFRAQCQLELAGMIPQDAKVRFCRWKSDDLHNRFILTDIGGVAFLEGLDQYMGKGRQDDVVVLLDKDVSTQLMRNFVRTETHFTFHDECEIIGVRRTE